MPKKTDNHNLKAKLALRRHMLRTYHGSGEIKVLDCCQGSGVIWSELRREFPVSHYWGVDMKPKPGRLKIDSVRILSQPGWRENVVDIDTYGSPWKHWFALLGSCRHDATVFLTIGQWQMGTDKLLIRAMGLQSLRVTPGISVKLQDPGLDYCLGAAIHSGFQVEAFEALNPGGSTRYIAAHITKSANPTD